MNYEHAITDELKEQGQVEISLNRNWIAYNTIPYFLDSSAMHFFSNEDDAREFAESNVSEYDNYSVIYACSLDDLLVRFGYEKEPRQHLSNPKDTSIVDGKKPVRKEELAGYQTVDQPPDNIHGHDQKQDLKAYKKKPVSKKL